MSLPRGARALRVALFGATGRTGRRVLARLLDRGLDVRALVRLGERLDARAWGRLAPGAVIEGDARDADLVLSTLAGADVVVSALGMHDVTEPATDLSDSLRAIVGTMPAAGVGRIVAVGCAVALPGALNATLPDAMRHVAAEHVRQHEVLRDAPVEWTLFCPASLRDDTPSGAVRTALDALPSGGGATGRDDLAEAIVAEVTAPRFTGHRVGIVSAAR